MSEEIKSTIKDKIIFVGGNLQNNEDIKITARYEPLKKKSSEEEGGCQKCQKFLVKKIVQLPKQKIILEFGTDYKNADQENITLESREIEIICYCGCCDKTAI